MTKRRMRGEFQTPPPAGDPRLLAVRILFTSSVLAHSAAEEMADGANNFLAALAPEQRAKAVFEFKNDERFDWHFVPKARKGLALKDMTTPQRLLAHALLSGGLSQRGYMTATTIMSLEQILYDLENQAPSRDAELYFVTIFGQPGPLTHGKKTPMGSE